MVELQEIVSDWLRVGDTPLLERIAELENRLDLEGWIRVGDLSDDNTFSLEAIKGIARKARKFEIENPLIERGVGVAADYTFGRGITIAARDEEINAVIQAFIDDPQNQVELTSHQAMLARDREQQCDGNTFLVLIVNELTGRVRVRSIPLAEIEDIICNPDDRKEPWYYKRVWIQHTFDAESGQYKDADQTQYYRDWRLCGRDDPYPTIAKQKPVENQYVMHIKTGSFSDWKFGLSEIYSALNWAKAYSKFLSNWSILMEAYARFAMMVKTKGGARGVAQAKTKLTTTSTTNNVETNPPANTGSTFIADEMIALDVVKTAGATTKADEGRRLALMSVSGMGLTEPIVMGDVSGTYATAQSLDRPTELKFSNRQEFWQSILKQILWFVVEQAVIAPSGILRNYAHVVTNEYGEQVVEFPEGIDLKLTVKFPEIVNLSIKDNISAIISAATLDGKQRTNFTDRMVTDMLLNALGVDEIDEILDELFPEGDLPAQESSGLEKVIYKLIEAMDRHALAA